MPIRGQEKGPRARQEPASKEWNHYERRRLHPDGDARLATEAELGQLEPEEVTAVEDVDEITTDIPVRTRRSDPTSAAARRRVDRPDV